HPYLSAAGALITLLAGLFVWWKNMRSATCRAFLFMTIALFVWFFGNSFSMIYPDNFQKSLLWYRIAYSTVPFLAPAFFHFYLVFLNKKSRAMPFILGLAFLEFFLLWFTDLPAQGAYALKNVGIVWKGMPVFSWILGFSMIRYFIIVLLCMLGFIREMKKETVPLRRKQLRNFAWIYGLLIMGWTEWIVGFDIPLHIAWLLVPVFILQFGYAIIHFRALEFDTVVHKTILWLTTIILLVVPAGMINLLLLRGFSLQGEASRVMILSAYLILFVAYYNRLRPRIDHLFRRRKYDYQTIMGKIAERIATSLNIEELTSRLLTELCEVMYLRNNILYTVSKDQTSFLLMGRMEKGKSSAEKVCSGLEIFN
ncbi:MAG: histidine kinase N-terminal 7TM domain-containing protein, partial [bacterium]|nr:histidine kinase N-terminal 7TM domain-containing protein [bacterium]